MNMHRAKSCVSARRKRIRDAGLRITRKISSQDPSMQLSMLLSEQKLSFYQGTDEVAYFSNNKLYVTDAEILDRLQLGKFAFIPRSNGNLSFRYLGGGNKFLAIKEVVLYGFKRKFYDQWIRRKMLEIQLDCFTKCWRKYIYNLLYCRSYRR